MVLLSCKDVDGEEREGDSKKRIGKRLSKKLDRQWKKSVVVRPPPSLKKLRVENKLQNLPFDDSCGC